MNKQVNKTLDRKDSYNKVTLMRRVKEEEEHKEDAYLSPSPSGFSKMIGSLRPHLWTYSNVNSKKYKQCNLNIFQVFSSILFFFFFFAADS